ncbi:phosphotransferase family protein [Baekduia soli]|uniref:phosphotransferase family protein n=1 Tax=Baekduia soli TaxID=496014 RepID=UPI0016521CB3|nr:phosphotransferase family protein [Baekduia soli]
MADEDVAGALQAWLAARGEDAGVRCTGRATVGLSQDTWFVRVDREGAAVDAVLRLPTPASGPRAIRTQRAALQAVAGRVPAPGLLWHDDGDDNPFGRPFLVMERIAGTVPVGWHDLGEPERAALAADAVDTLAALHRIAPGDLDAPEVGPGEAPTELEFYARRLERLGELPAVLRGALWWLARHEPAPLRSALVHGDFRMGNMIVADGRLAAVLDWEMAGAGDPLSDLAWCFIPVWEPAGVDEAALVERYAQATGAPVDAGRLHWHRVLGYVRCAYYNLAGVRAFARGHSDDLRLAALAHQLPVHLDRLAATLAGEAIT